MKNKRRGALGSGSTDKAEWSQVDGDLGPRESRTRAHPGYRREGGEG